MKMPLTLSFTASLFITLITTLAVSLSRPGCQETCGNVTIPYPFGIGNECSGNSSFTVTCQNATTPFLSSINLEVVNISTRGTIRVKHPVSLMTCSNEQAAQLLGRSLRNTPFTISSRRNSLAVLGCQNSVWLRANATTTIGGCMAVCDVNSTDSGCNGVNCCQTSIPEGLKELQFTYRSFVSGTGNNRSCGYVFLADQKWFQEDYRRYRRLHDYLQNPFDEEFVYATMVLEWEFHSRGISPYGRCEDPRIRYNRNNGYDMYIMSIFPDRYESWNYQCQCVDGFEGNPYLLDGCHDIDECSGNSTRYHTCGNGTCINHIGYYSCQHPEDKLSRVKPALIGIGSGLGALLLLIGAFMSSKVIIKRIKDNRKQNFFKRNGGLLLEQQLSSTNNGVEKTKLFSSKELIRATDNYNANRILGRGGQGTVYKGMLIDGKIVAVKKSKKVEEGDLQVFINEVVILSQINHRNVVKLLGCCLETEVPLLVYEFIPNGTLFQHIHDPNDEVPLTWEIRVRIAKEIAGALSYLHSSASAPIYHRDIKSTNILLDDKYRAKVADFGTSRTVAIDQTHLTTRVLGTFGYLDPEYFQSSQFTEKSDVYSFGVVMVELLTGERAISSSSIRDEAGRSLVTHFLHSMEENHLFDVLDVLVLKAEKREEIVAFAKIARRCLHLNGKGRPTMREVMVELEALQMMKETSDFQEIIQVDIRDYISVGISESFDFSSVNSQSTFLDSSTSTAAY
ncbi:hypothetical protein ACJIZ3_016315 [Penstemon smallii]|uniref:Protein kinase domain-containing protein n=1 Tax=Penstemon smallii TaxID=265156 RepID=A0ABD3RSE0_9LAMI